MDIASCTCGCGKKPDADYWHAWQAGRARGAIEARSGTGEQRRGWLTRRARRAKTGPLTSWWAA